MINILIQRLKEQKNSVIVYALSLIGYVLLMISMFPSMEKMDIDALIKSYPEDFAKFFGESGMASFGTIEGFLSMEFLSFFFILIIAFYIGSAAGSAIAGQIEKKTIDFNLTQSVSRTKMILAEVLTALFYSAILVISTNFSIWLFCQLFGVEIAAKGLFAFTVLAIPFVWAIYAIGLLLSSFLKSKIKVMLLTFSLTLASYVFLSMTRLVDTLKDYDRFSIFYLYSPEKILVTGNINWTHILILIVIFCTALSGSILIFNKKDV